MCYNIQKVATIDCSIKITASFKMKKSPFKACISIARSFADSDLVSSLGYRRKSVSARPSSHSGETKAWSFFLKVCDGSGQAPKFLSVVRKFTYVLHLIL